MAVLRIPDAAETITGEAEIRARLAGAGIDYERWSLDRVPAGCSADEVLHAYAAEIDAMKQRGGYVTADVIDVNPDTPNLEAMLKKFDKEHTHSEDEVRFILAGRGIFFLVLGEDAGKGVAAVEVYPGDMLRVPRGTRHWFTLCADRRIRAIRWFQETSGWAPHYTDSGKEKNYQPLCFGPAYLGPRIATDISIGSVGQSR
jgi:1,2-dihydroxy-3-keto-5-methylthiopentene dioxygenase